MYTYNFDYDCPWYLFDNSYKSLLGACLMVFGICGVLLNGWLFVTFIHSHLLTFKSHLLVLNLCGASLGRNLLGGFPFSGSSALAKRWLFGPYCCQVFAFFNQFLGVFQMAALVVICIERYYQAKYYKNEKDLSIKLYVLLVSVCWLWSSVLAIPPLAGYGSYSCDVSNTACTLDWSLDSSRQIGFNVPYVIGGAVAPVIAIIYFICKALPLERRIYRSEQQKEQLELTKSVTILTVLTLLSWLPAAALAGLQAGPHLVLGYRQQPPLPLVLVAPLASEVATCLPVLCYLAADPRIRTALLGRVRKNYGIIKNKNFNPRHFDQL